MQLTVSYQDYQVHSCMLLLLSKYDTYFKQNGLEEPKKPQIFPIIKIQMLWNVLYNVYINLPGKCQDF